MNPYQTTSHIAIQPRHAGFRLLAIFTLVLTILQVAIALADFVMIHVLSDSPDWLKAWRNEPQFGYSRGSQALALVIFSCYWFVSSALMLIARLAPVKLRSDWGNRHWFIVLLGLIPVLNIVMSATLLVRLTSFRTGGGLVCLLLRLCSLPFAIASFALALLVSRQIGIIAFSVWFIVEGFSISWAISNILLDSRTAHNSM